jgi:N-methylhydantoinase A
MGFESAKRAFEFSFQGRYLYQSWDIEVGFEFPGDTFADGDLARLLAAFHRTHERIYTIKDENDVVEFTTWKLRAIGNTGGAGRRGHAATQATAKLEPKSRRPVYLGTALGMTEIPVYDGQATGPGTDIAGPALIEEPTTTFLLLPGQLARVDGYGNYIVEIG